MVTLDLSRFCLPLRNTRPQNRGLRSWEFEIWLKKHVGTAVRQSSSPRNNTVAGKNGEKLWNIMKHVFIIIYPQSSNRKMSEKIGESQK
jgi:hypothetical protein